MKKNILIFLCLFLISVIVVGGEMLGFGKKEKVYPFSGFSGQLLYKGSPARNAQITRQYELGGDRYKEDVISDDDGYFSFESIVIDYAAPLLSPVEFLSHQDIIVNYQNKDFVIWTGGKTEKGEYSEFGSKPVNLKCELTEELRKIKFKVGFIGTNCRWD